jgi:hypothetical protein
MAVTSVGPARWVVVDEVPERGAAGCVYDSAAWLRGWERAGIERRTRQAYVCAGDDVLPLYETTSSPLWHEYERRCGLVGRFGSPIVFAGSPYFVAGKRVAEPLVRGAHATAMSWIERGDADVLVVPNLTSAGVDSWREFAGPPVGTVHLARMYRVRGSAGGRLHWLDGKGSGLRVLEGAEVARRGMPDIPGVLLVVADTGDVYFGFRRGDEVVFLCGGVDHHRFMARHGLPGTELWAMVYAPTARSELVTVLNGMHATLHACIQAA